MDRSTGEFPDDTPLRLDVAVKAAFPAGGITVAGLRKEIAKGRLDVELIAGKLFTTLSAIAQMRERCRVIPKKLPSRDDVVSRNGSEAEVFRTARANLEALVASTPSMNARVRSRSKR